MGGYSRQSVDQVLTKIEEVGMFLRCVCDADEDEGYPIVDHGGLCKQGCVLTNSQARIYSVASKNKKRSQKQNKENSRNIIVLHDIRRFAINYSML